MASSFQTTAVIISAATIAVTGSTVAAIATGTTFVAAGVAVSYHFMTKGLMSLAGRRYKLIDKGNNISADWELVDIVDV